MDSNRSNCTMANNDFVYTLNNFISNEFCNELIDFYLLAEERIGTDMGNSAISKTQHVNCASIELSARYKYINLCEELDSKRKELNLKVHEVMEKIAFEIYTKYKIFSRNDSGYNLRKIHGPTLLHKDGVNDNIGKPIHPDKIRTVSVIICLNEGHGCEFNFPKQSKKFIFRKGQVVVFPPFWTHPHEVSAPINNTYRYTINTWFFE